MIKSWAWKHCSIGTANHDLDAALYWKYLWYQVTNYVGLDKFMSENVCLCQILKNITTLHNLSSDECPKSGDLMICPWGWTKHPSLVPCTKEGYSDRLEMGVQDTEVWWRSPSWSALSSPSTLHLLSFLPVFSCVWSLSKSPILLSLGLRRTLPLPNTPSRGHHGRSGWAWGSSDALCYPDRAIHLPHVEGLLQALQDHTQWPSWGHTESGPWPVWQGPDPFARK